MKKKLALISCMIFLFNIMGINTFGDVAPLITTDGFAIEDTVLLNSLAQYDADNNGVLTKEEMSGVTGLTLDGLPIKSLKGLENFELVSISANDCEIESLDGVRDIKELKNLYLDGNNITELGDISGMWYLESIQIRNNKLSDINDLEKLLSNPYIRKIKIEGNPLYAEATEFLFYEYYKPISIIGKADGSAFQKNSIYPLSVDLDRMADFQELIDVELPDIEMEIENTEVATVGESYDIERYRPFDATFPDSSTVTRVNLLNEGHTRMKITCGDLVRYTDIIVLSEDSTDELKIEMESISDKNIMYSLGNVEKTYTGIISEQAISEIKDIEVDSSEGAVMDFESFAAFTSLNSLKLIGYNQELLDSVKGLDENVTIKELIISEGDIRNLGFNNNIDTVEKIKAVNNRIESVNLETSFGNLKYLDLRNNNISEIENINIPETVKEVYLDGNPLDEEDYGLLFEKYMFNDDIIGAIDSEIEFDLKTDVISGADIKIEITDEDIASRRGYGLKLKEEGITVMKVSFGLDSKYVTVISGEYDEFLSGDINGDKTRDAEDALGILKNAAKLSVFTDFITNIADINADNVVTADDALEILKIAAKIK